MFAYFADPRLGRRRRALAGAKLAHAGRSGRRRMGTAGRTVANHTRGLWARIVAGIRAEQAADEVVEQRVRAALGRLSRHVSAIEVDVADGEVTLHGPILEREHHRLVKAARRVRGVRNLRDHLVRHLRSDVSGLRGASEDAPQPTSQRRRGDFMQSNPPRGSARRRAACTTSTPQSVRASDSVRLGAKIMSVANIDFLPVLYGDRRVV